MIKYCCNGFEVSLTKIENSFVINGTGLIPKTVSKQITELKNKAKKIDFIVAKTLLDGILKSYIQFTI